MDINWMIILFVDRKAHRNGIKKAKRKLHESTLGVSVLSILCDWFEVLCEFSRVQMINPIHFLCSNV